MTDRLSPTAEYFRAGVGAVIYNADGLVLALERRDIPGGWQLPQGGLKAGETVEEALFREVEEETGLTRGAFGSWRELPLWLGYELPAASRRKKTGRGQVHKWCVLEFTGEESAIDLGRDGEFRSWRWIEFSQLAEIVVHFRRPIYQHLARVSREARKPSSRRKR
jgi:putative (di)nucleoside polyphosphate hydrolase